MTKYEIVACLNSWSDWNRRQKLSHLLTEYSLAHTFFSEKVLEMAGNDKVEALGDSLFDENEFEALQSCEICINLYIFESSLHFFDHSCGIRAAFSSFTLQVCGQN